MPVVAAMSIREANQLFRSWGFTYEGGNGGHAVWVLNDRRVQLPAQGRHAPVTEVMLRKAAGIVGVSMAKFKLGPPVYPNSAPFVPDAPAEIDLRDPNGHTTNGNGHANGNGHHNGNGGGGGDHHEEEEPEPQGPDTRTPSEKVFEYLRGRPNLRVKYGDMASQLGMKSPNCMSALRTVMKNHPEVQKVGYGMYSYIQEKAEPDPKELHQERMQRLRAYERVATDPHGRVVLKDSAGELWIAVKIEPTFYPLSVTLHVEEQA